MAEAVEGGLAAFASGNDHLAISAFGRRTLWDGIDLAGGDDADALSGGGPALPPDGVEPQLKDAGIAQSRSDQSVA